MAAPPPPEHEPDVDESGEESFPASDPPEWTPTRSEPDVKPAEDDPPIPGAPRRKQT